MSRRYTYSRTIDTPEGKETFTAEQFDSFDEARNAVEKGVHDRRLQFPRGIVSNNIALAPANEIPTSGPADAKTTGPTPEATVTWPAKTN